MSAAPLADDSQKLFDVYNLVMKKITIATRESALALWQAHFVRDRLMEAHPGLDAKLLGMTTKGDQWLNAPLKEIWQQGLFIRSWKWPC